MCRILSLHRCSISEVRVVLCILFKWLKRDGTKCVWFELSGDDEVVAVAALTWPNSWTFNLATFLFLFLVGVLAGLFLFVSINMQCYAFHCLSISLELLKYHQIVHNILTMLRLNIVNCFLFVCSFSHIYSIRFSFDDTPSIKLNFLATLP